MKKDYCTQNNGKCETCSLVNYRRDCKNEPLSQLTRKGTKYSRMIDAYTGFKGTATVGAVLAQLPETLKKELTGRQLGLVMTAINQAYHNGKASCGAEVIDGDAIWINSLQALVELDAIHKLVAGKEAK